MTLYTEMNSCPIYTVTYWCMDVEVVLSCLQHCVRSNIWTRSPAHMLPTRLPDTQPTRQNV